MQRRRPTPPTLRALALPLPGPARACGEDNVSAREEDKSGINDVPPPSGATGAGNAVGGAVGPSGVSAGSGPLTSVGPGGGAGDGGAGGAGDGGAGGSGGAGGAPT